MKKKDSHISELKNILSQFQGLSKNLISNSELVDASSSLIHIQNSLLDAVKPVLHSQNEMIDLVSNMTSTIPDISLSLKVIQQSLIDNIEPTFQSQNEMKDLVRKLTSALPDVSTNLQEMTHILIDSIVPSSNQIQNQLENLSKSMNSAFIEIEKSFFSEYKIQINESFKKTFTNFYEQMELLPKQTREALLILGNHGWFFDLDMPLPYLWKLEKMIFEGDIEGAEDSLTIYFRENLSDIQQNLIENFPHRAKVINSAFNAHIRKEYDLSIPVILSQVDGICFEAVNQYLFIRNNKRPSTAMYVDTFISNNFRTALLAPLSEPLPISASQKERGESFNELNRHQVLHGESLNYGTEINGLKSISLLNYVAKVLHLDDIKK